MGSLELWRDSRALEALVRSGLFEDEKAVVDMPLLCPTLGPLSRALQLREGGGARATAVLGSGSSQTGLGAHQEHTTEGGQVAGGGQQEAGQESMRGVVAEFFLPPGADLIQTVPSDFRPDPCLVTSPSLVTATASAPSPPSTTLPAVVTSQPPFLPLVTDPAVRAWALEVHRLWPSLCRRCAPGVAQHPSQHSLLPLPGPFFIPGQRFREMYYWDSYWIVRGLLASGMRESAASVVRNLLHMLRLSGGGFVPNGSRSYYLNRSQPPLLSETLRAVYEDHKRQEQQQQHPRQQERQLGQQQQQQPEEEGGGASSAMMDLVREALPLLVQEHTFWTSEPHQVLVRSPGSGRVHALSRYHANWNRPRPESHGKDLGAAEACEDKPRVYREFATVAESGWDFSSRWMSEPSILASSRPTTVLPADLNALLLRMERNIAFFATELLISGAPLSNSTSTGTVPANSTSTGTVPANSPADVSAQSAPGSAPSRAANSGEPSGELRSLVVAMERAADERQLAIDELMWAPQPVSALPTSTASEPGPEGALATGRWTDVWLRAKGRESIGGGGSNGEVWEVEARPWVYPANAKGAMEGKSVDSPQAEGAGLAGEAIAPPIYASDFLPLWCGVLPPGGLGVNGVVHAFLESGLLGEGGVAASTLRTGEQWDFPNAWPPLQHALCEAFAHAGTTASADAAAQIHHRFLASAMAAWRCTGVMHEKYDAEQVGGVGRGGEYEPQVGFGWTNGAALALLSEFGWPFRNTQ